MHLHGTPIRTVIAHPTAYISGYLGLGFVALLSLVGFAFSVWFGLIVRRADRLALYEDGLAREYRLLSTKRTFAEYDSVQDLEMRQGLVERFFNIGTLHINTAGSHGQEIIFPGIYNCHEFEAEIRDHMRPKPVDTPAS
jgi:uncharacterized membrane protein YdbT with pleckstrin-like domain